MAHEFAPPEEEENSQPATFNLERMTGDQLAAIVHVVGAVAMAGEPGSESPLARQASAIGGMLVQDLWALPERAPGHAYTFFTVLASDESWYARATAIHGLAGPLIRAYSNDEGVSRNIAEKLVTLLDGDPDDVVREIARDTLSKAVCEGWVEEPLATDLDNKLPDGWRRDDP